MIIKETINENIPQLPPIKEKMNIHIPNMIEGIPNRNGCYVVQVVLEKQMSF